MTDLHGWRLTGAAWHPALGVKFAHVDASGRFTPAECRPHRYPTPHRPHASPAPAEGCTCGYHLVPRLADLLAWPDFAHREDPETAPLEPALRPYAAELVKFWTAVTVAASGRILPAATAEDPPGTVRASHLRLTGAVVLDGTAPPEVAGLLTASGMDVHEVPSLEDLARVAA